nr:hypothetical protein [Tanacetum cinerariifolium]
QHWFSLVLLPVAFPKELIGEAEFFVKILERRQGSSGACRFIRNHQIFRWQLKVLLNILGSCSLESEGWVDREQLVPQRPSFFLVPLEAAEISQSQVPCLPPDELVPRFVLLVPLSLAPKPVEGFLLLYYK